MFEMQSVLEGPAPSKARLAALAAFFHLTVATVLLVGLAWRIDAVDAPNLMEAFLPVAFLPAEWSAPLPHPERPQASTPAGRPAVLSQPHEVTDAPAASLSSETLAPIDPATAGSESTDVVIPGIAAVGPIGGSGPSTGHTVVYTSDMVAPAVLYRIDPRYPDAARLAHRQGVVVVEAEIATDGSLQSARVVSSPLGFGLEQSALDAIRSWRFTPARHGERPVAVYYRWNIQFSLR